MAKNTTKLFFLFCIIFFLSEKKTVNAQTHYPIRNTTHKLPDEKDTDSFEKMGYLWKLGLNELKQQANASDEDFKLFTNFCRSYIDSECFMFNQFIKSGRINLTNIHPYIDSIKQKIKSRYTKFLTIKSEYPSSVAQNQTPSYTPPTCNGACTNMDFSGGNLSGWYGYYGLNTSTTSYNITIGGGGSLAGLQRGALSPISNTYQVHLTSAGNNDWFLNNYHGINMSEASPWGSGYSVMIGDSVNKGVAGQGGIVGVITQDFNVTSTTNSITYAYSVFLENPNHPYYEQPFFSVTVFDQNGDTIPNCGKYDVVSSSGLNGFLGEYYSPRADTIYWKNWTEVNVPLNHYVGQCVTIQFEVSDCGPSGHCGYAYVDASCGQFAINASSAVICPSSSVTLTGPSAESAYLWTGPTNGIIGSSTSQSVTVDSGGTYTLVLTPATGALCKDTLQYTINREQLSIVPTHVTCTGGNTGSATVTELNGISPFTYLWAPTGQTSTTATGLTAGTYTATVKDNNGCSVSATVTITQPQSLTVTMNVPTNPLCNGGTGSAIVTATGGVSPYTYSWSPIGGTNVTGTGLTAGTYTVTVSDNNGCTGTPISTVIITQPAAPVTPTISANPGVSCYGATTTATITTSGGTSPYTYLWSPIGGTNATGTGLTVGTYTITIKDINGCTPTAANTTVIVTQPAAPVSPTISANPGVSCYGGTTTATLSISGGTSPYTYSWSPIGGTNATGTGLTVGTYTITIKDKNGCTATSGATTVIVTQPAAPVSPTISANPGVSCYGATTTATITTSGGTSPYTYSWSPIGGTNATGTGLTVGTYTVTIKDINGCTATSGATTVIVTQPAAPVSPTISANPGVSCYGATTTATITTSGGTSPYTYSWSPIGGTNATGTGLTVGTYTVTIKDINGCTATSGATTVIVTQPAAPVSPTISANPGVSFCYGATTTATITTSGGTSPYTYSWSPIGGTNATGTGLTVGTYTVTIKDKNGCTATSGATTVIVTQPAAPVSPTISANPGVSCYGATTTATITTSGGTSPYTYSWSPIGGTNSTGTGLTVGTYTVTIKDKNGCTATSGATTVIVTQPAAPVSPTISANPGVSCYGATTTATITTSGGTSPYTYSWSPIGGTNSTGTGLTVGTYTVIIKDINGCTATSGATTIIVTQPAAPVNPTISANPGVSCYGGTTTATITTSGGTSPYTYSWSPIGGTNATGTGLTVGTYTITIKDINGCTATSGATTIIVTQPAAPVSPTISANGGIGCYGGTTTAIITTSGGTSPYTYSWSPIGGTNATGTGLTVGTYTVTIKDINGCTATSGATTVIVTQPAAPVSPTISANPGISCYGGTTTATITTSGGTSPYTYSWSPIGGTNTTGTGLTVGTYTITIKDINGCTATSGATTIIVTQPAAYGTTISSMHAFCGLPTGSATVSVTGSTSPYTYSWNPSGQTNSTATGLSAGIYTVTITDINSCPTTASITVTQVSSVGATISGNTPVTCYGYDDGTATLTTIGGTSPYTYTWSPIGGTNATGTGLTAGTYTINVVDAQGCIGTSTTIVVITQPTVVGTTTSANAGISCYGGTESATLSTTGGTSPYTYSWSPIGGTNATGTGLTAGTYTVTITDANACTPTSGTVTVIVTQPLPVTSASTGGTNGISCYGDNNGSATLTTSGGASPYTYLWSPIGGTNATGTGLTAGTYTITVTDKNGCIPTSITTVVVTQPAVVGVTTSANAGIPCYGGTATVTLSTTGGTSPYTYSWSPIGGTNATGTGLTVGTYTVTIKDINGCAPTSITTVIVTQPNAINTIIASTYTTACIGESITLSASGATTYLWSNGNTSSSINLIIQPGDTAYWVIGMTGGCSDTSAITKIKLFKPTMTACCNTKILLGEDTTIYVIGKNLTYQWNDPNNSLNYDTGTTVIATPVITTTYTVTGTDAQGCTVDTTITIEIEIPCFGNLTIPNVFTPTDAGILGLDNKFYIKTENLDSWDILIFDRWGVQVYSSTDPFIYWNGNTPSGSKAPSGVYYYSIHASCQGHTYKRDGYVQLIR